MISQTFPKLNNSKSTKDQIISILANEWPLSAKQVYNHVLKERGKTVSYQAIHKTVAEMVSDGILQRVGNEYRLSQDWIDCSKKFFEDLNSDYSSKGNNGCLDSVDSKLFTFWSLSEVARFIVHDFYSEKYPPNGKPSVCCWKHAWPVVGCSDKEYNAMVKMFKEVKHYGFAKDSTVLDQIFEKFLGKIGKIVSCGINFSAHEDTFVQGDYVAEVYFDGKFKKELGSIYKKVKTFEKAEDINTFFREIITKKTKINVLVVKNPDLADQIRKEAIELYNKAKKKK